MENKSYRENKKSYIYIMEISDENWVNQSSKKIEFSEIISTLSRNILIKLR